MMKNLLFIAIFLTAILSAACSEASAPGVNKNASVSSNTASNIPPEFSTSPITPGANQTPGIPDPKNVNINVKQGTTPTPGIPDPKTIGKTPVPKGATPTPGIPDEKTLREQMQKLSSNVNMVNQIPKNIPDAQKKLSDKKNAQKP
jgi:hypothetical protein